MRYFWKAVINDELIMAQLAYVVHLHMIRESILISDALAFFGTLYVAPEITLPICLQTHFPYYLKFYPFGVLHGWCYVYVRSSAPILPAFEQAVLSDAFGMQEIVHGTGHYSCVRDTSCFADFKNLLFIGVMRWFALFFGSSKPILLLLNIPNDAFLEERQCKITAKYAI